MKGCIRRFFCWHDYDSEGIGWEKEEMYKIRDGNQHISKTWLWRIMKCKKCGNYTTVKIDIV